MKWLIAMMFAALAVASSASAQPRPPIHGIPVLNVCGGITGRRCEAPGTYCAMTPGVCGRIRDGQGTCRPRPRVCDKIYAPVCGCDGRTYSNSCVAAADGANILHAGKCLPPHPPGIFPPGHGGVVVKRPPAVTTVPNPRGFPGVPVDRPQGQQERQ